MKTTNDTTLKIGTDAGMQTRVLSFDEPVAAGRKAQRQGDSTAR